MPFVTPSFTALSLSGSAANTVPSYRYKPLQVAVRLGLFISIGLYTASTYAASTYAASTYDPDSTDTLPSTTAAPSMTLDTLKIYADSYRTAGTKTSLDPDEAPISYTRIEQETLAERQADTVAAALRYEPGVSTESRGTVTLFDEYRIRGFEAGSTYYDGLQLPRFYNGNLQPQVDAYATEAIEVVKGSASSLYGYGSPGGIVNQVAKVPNANPAHEVQLRTGNQNLQEIAVDSTGALTDSINYRLVALGRKKDGQMVETQEERVLLNPSLAVDINDSLSVLASVYYQDDPHQVPSTPLPGIGTIKDASYGKLASDAYAGDRWNNFAKEVLMPTVSINWDINDQLKFKHISRYTKADSQQQNTYHYENPAYGLTTFVPGTDSVLMRTAYTTDESIKNYATDNQLLLNMTTGIVNHDLLLGVEYQDSEYTFDYSTSGFGAAPTLDLTQPNYQQIKGNVSLAQAQDDVIDIKQLGYYLQDEMAIDKVTLIAGIRHDSYEQTVNNKLTGSIEDYDDSNTSGRLAALYRFDNGLSPFASYSQSYQPLVGTDADTGTPYEAITANQIEAGLKYADAATQASLALYKITRENELVPDLYNYRKFKQVGETESKGFEASLRNRVNDWLDVAASYSLTDAEIIRDDAPFIGNTPAQIAKHQANLWTDFYPTPDLKLNLGVRYQGGVEIDKVNTGKLPAVTLVDIGADYQINPLLSVGASVSNVFDKTYVGSCYDTNNCWMGPERQMSLSLKANF